MVFYARVALVRPLQRRPNVKVADAVCRYRAERGEPCRPAEQAEQLEAQTAAFVRCQRSSLRGSLFETQYLDEAGGLQWLIPRKVGTIKGRTEPFRWHGACFVDRDLGQRFS